MQFWNLTRTPLKMISPLKSILFLQFKNDCFNKNSYDHNLQSYPDQLSNYSKTILIAVRNHGQFPEVRTKVSSSYRKKRIWNSPLVKIELRIFSHLLSWKQSAAKQKLSNTQTTLITQLYKWGEKKSSLCMHHQRKKTDKPKCIGFFFCLRSVSRAVAQPTLRKSVARG